MFLNKPRVIKRVVFGAPNMQPYSMIMHGDGMVGGNFGNLINSLVKGGVRTVSNLFQKHGVKGIVQKAVNTGKRLIQDQIEKITPEAVMKKAVKFGTKISNREEGQSIKDAVKIQGQKELLKLKRKAKDRIIDPTFNQFKSDLGIPITKPKPKLNPALAQFDDEITQRINKVVNTNRNTSNSNNDLSYSLSNLIAGNGMKRKPRKKKQTGRGLIAL